MARVHVKVNGLQENMKKIMKTVNNQANETMTDCIIDLTTISSEITPYEDGNLEKSWDNDVYKVSEGVQGKVRFECWADQPRRYEFNYAIWIHEETYNLGPGSEQKGGSTGSSGAYYPVGNKYLTRPLDGESPHYRDRFEEEIKGALRKLD